MLSLVGQGKKSVTRSIIVMENLFYGRSIPGGLKFDLKGKTREKVEQDGGGALEENDIVLLDSDLLRHTKGFPIGLDEHSKRNLNVGVAHDTTFLTTINVVDYSILMGIDEERGELVLGIIDYVRSVTHSYTPYTPCIPVLPPRVARCHQWWYI